MKELTFILISEEKEEINFKTNYYINNETIHFKSNDTIYEYNMKEEILKKKDNDHIIIMDFPNKQIIIELLDNKLKFNMEITEYNIEIEPNEIRIMYKYIGEEETTNKIFIKY